MFSGNMKALTTIAIGLVAALAAQQAMAVIVEPGSPCSQERIGDELLQSSFDQLFAAGASGANSSYPASEDSEDQVPHAQPGTFADGNWSCDPASVSGTSSGCSLAAIANNLVHLPDASLQSSLPREAVIVLATGPPFELLRPA
jgi:hypothetical protein